MGAQLISSELDSKTQKDLNIVQSSSPKIFSKNFRTLVFLFFSDLSKPIVIQVFSRFDYREYNLPCRCIFG